VVETLADLGYRTIEAVDGPSGLDILKSDARIDFLVTDVGLPGINGRQLADAGRVERPELKILFMTGYAHNASGAKGLLEPGMELITKPFTIETLSTQVRSILEA
jgi:CheY-like chemotaxis protein